MGTDIIGRIVNIGFWLKNHQYARSVLGGSSEEFPWDNHLFSAIKAALYLLTAYGLARWLYPFISLAPQDVTVDESSADEHEQS